MNYNDNVPSVKTFKFRNLSDPVTLHEDMDTAKGLLSSLTYRCPTTGNVDLSAITKYATRPNSRNGITIEEEDWDNARLIVF